MSDTGVQYPHSETDVVAPNGGSITDYIRLMKPRVMSLVLFTAFTGLVVAPGSMHPVLALAALICIGVGAGASGALNMWYDADIDSQMARTAARPIPRGRITPQEARTFGIVLAIGSVLCLGMLVNWSAAVLLSVTIAFYIFIYTMWLKRRTPQNIVIGGAAGSFPPMIGWAAATGTVSLDSILLFLIIFMWTPPHFWALALVRKRDYERVGVPMLPVVAGEDETRRQILLYSLLLTPLAVAPALSGLAGTAYAVTSVTLGIVFLALAVNVYRVTQGKQAEKAARRLFSFSILYLFLLYAVLLAEHAFGFAGGGS
ncbi:MAG: heme o synthase [Hyphomicrobiales bacterium]|nr:heme o synthase [Hyphomicrobiales bacterium]